MTSQGRSRCQSGGRRLGGGRGRAHRGRLRLEAVPDHLVERGQAEPERGGGRRRIEARVRGDHLERVGGEAGPGEALAERERQVDEARGNRPDAHAPGRELRRPAQQLTLRERDRADEVEDAAGTEGGIGGRERRPREILDVERLLERAAAPRHHRDGVAQVTAERGRPLGSAPEQQGQPQDGVGEARGADGALGLSLAPPVAVRRARVGADRAREDQPGHAAPLRRRDHAARGGDVRLLVRGARSLDEDPGEVDHRGGPPEGGLEGRGVGVGDARDAARPHRGAGRAPAPPRRSGPRPRSPAAGSPAPRDEEWPARPRCWRR